MRTPETIPVTCSSRDTQCSTYKRVYKYFYCCVFNIFHASTFLSCFSSTEDGWEWAEVSSGSMSTRATYRKMPGSR